MLTSIQKSILKERLIDSNRSSEIELLDNLLIDSNNFESIEDMFQWLLSKPLNVLEIN